MFISIAPSFIAFRRGELAQRKAYINGIKILFLLSKIGSILMRILYAF